MNVQSRAMIPQVTSKLPLAPPGSVGPTSRSYWVVEGRLAAGAYPGKKGRGPLEFVPEVIEQLLGVGIDRYVNLTQDYPGGTDEHLDRYDVYVDAVADIDRFPIPDLDVPDEGEMVRILDHLDAQLAAGHNAYVHCWGGVGRTGTVVGCWLIRHGYATTSEVMEIIGELRLGDLGIGKTRISPETPGQWSFLASWEAGQ